MYRVKIVLVIEKKYLAIYNKLLLYRNILKTVWTYDTPAMGLY